MEDEYLTFDEIYKILCEPENNEFCGMLQYFYPFYRDNKLKVFNVKSDKSYIKAQYNFAGELVFEYYFDENGNEINYDNPFKDGKYLRVFINRVLGSKDNTK